MFAEQVCSAELIFIMVYGGFGTKWSGAKPIAVKAVLTPFKSRLNQQPLVAFAIITVIDRVPPDVDIFRIVLFSINRKIYLL